MLETKRKRAKLGKDRDYSGLFQKIGYSFKDKNKLELALTHCSYEGTNNRNNQRLEFLGDAILEFVVSDIIFKKSGLTEGAMTRIRAGAVCEESLYKIALSIDLGKYLYIGKGEEATDGRAKPSILSDALEALIGAVYLDGGIRSAARCIEKILGKSIEELIAGGSSQDYKTELQKAAFALYSSAPKYVQTGQKGPAHDMVFEVAVYIDGKKYASAEGKTKKQAEQKAAYLTLQMLGINNNGCLT